MPNYDEMMAGMHPDHRKEVEDFIADGAEPTDVEELIRELRGSDARDAVDATVDRIDAAQVYADAQEDRVRDGLAPNRKLDDDVRDALETAREVMSRDEPVEEHEPDEPQSFDETGHTTPSVPDHMKLATNEAALRKAMAEGHWMTAEEMHKETDAYRRGGLGASVQSFMGQVRQFRRDGMMIDRRSRRRPRSGRTVTEYRLVPDREIVASVEG